MSYIIDCKRVDLAPVTEPVTLAEAKAQLLVDFTDDDTFITSLITRARAHVESYCNISIVNKRITFLGYLDCQYELPYGPVITLEGVNTAQGQTGSGPVTYAPSEADWSIQGDFFNGGYGTESIFINSRYGNIGMRWQIIYTSGMSGLIPDDLRQGILVQIAFLYENRGKDVGVSGVCEQARELINPYRKLWI